MLQNAVSLQNLATVTMNITGATLCQAATVSGHSEFSPGLTTIGNDGLLSVRTCNLVKMGDSSSSAVANSSNTGK